MRRSTLLISRHLLDAYEELKNMNSSDFQDLLNQLLKDPFIWEKINLLESEKFTKTYQRDGLDLVAVKFYPLEEDWCKLSVLSNGTGFSRCYIFVYLLEYYLGLRKLLIPVTTQKKICKEQPHTELCRVKVSKIHHYLERNLRPKRKKNKIKPKINRIPLEHIQKKKFRGKSSLTLLT